MPQVSCKWCGTEFEAKRSSAKFCSDTCRMANHRYHPKAEIDQHMKNAFYHVNQIVKLYEKDDSVTLDAIEALAAVKLLLQYHVPGRATWWHDRATGTSVQTDIPDMAYRHDKQEWVITEWKG